MSDKNTGDDVSLLHDQLLKQHAEDIKEIKSQIYGLPQKINNLEDRFNEMCTMLKEVLNEMKDGYQRKDMCSMVQNSVEERFKALEKADEDNQTAIEELRAIKDKLSMRIIYLLGFLAFQLLVFIFINYPKFIGIATQVVK